MLENLYSGTFSRLAPLFPSLLQKSPQVTSYVTHKTYKNPHWKGLEVHVSPFSTLRLTLRFISRCIYGLRHHRTRAARPNSVPSCPNVQSLAAVGALDLMGFSRLRFVGGAQTVEENPVPGLHIPDAERLESIPEIATVAGH